jgi:hypothetical protein
MDVVGREDELLFALSISFSRTVQLPSAVPTQTATLRPDVLPFDFQRIQRTFDVPMALSVSDRQPTVDSHEDIDQRPAQFGSARSSD